MVTPRETRAVVPAPDTDLRVWARALVPGLDGTAFDRALGVFLESGVDSTAEATAATALLADLGFDADTLAATLLLERWEQGELDAESLKTNVGADVVRLLEGAQKMHVIDDLHRARDTAETDPAQWEALRRMLFAMASDVRVVIITLAWCVARLRAAKNAAAAVKTDLARNALDVYAPLANRLGIWQIKWEIEDFALRYLEPEQYKALARALEERRVDRENYIANFIDALKTALRDAGIDAEIKGRPKHIYSIWKKMQRKNLGFDEIFDIRAVRVIVKSVAECYAVLGIVHSRWSYIRSEFDDYIAAPKDNNYQSLHTAVVGPDDKIIEVQIRTPDMDAHAELGVAAHWRYKEGAAADLTLERKLTWLRQLLDWRDSVVAGEAPNAEHQAALGERIYVFTPKGKIIDLPVGATPLDFAYTVHTDVGHRCRGAKINNRIVPLTHTLHHGDVVEIITVKQGGPSRDWMNPGLGFIKSSRAREKVSAWFKQEYFADDVADGRAQLEKELLRAHLTDVNFERLAQRYEYDVPDKLFAAIGRGELKVAQVISALHQTAPRAESEPRLPTAAPAPRAKSSVYVEGEGNVLANFAKCCKPLPGDTIVGYVTRGRGVTIHRAGCANVARYRSAEPERLLSAGWGAETAATYPVDIYIVATDRQGLLRDITAVLVNEKINVSGTHSLSSPQENRAHITLTLQLQGVGQLERVLGQIRQLPSVLSARRSQ